MFSSSVFPLPFILGGFPNPIIYLVSDTLHNSHGCHGVVVPTHRIIAVGVNVDVDIAAWLE